MAAGSSPNSSRRYRPDTIYRLPTLSDYSCRARPMRCKVTSHVRSSEWSRPTKRHLVTDLRACSPASFWPTRWRAQTLTRKRWHWSRGFSKSRVHRNGAPLFPSYGGFAGRWLLRQSATNSQDAERFFGTALRIADEQGANVFRLNAGIPLARMLAEGGRREEAKSILDHVNAIKLDEWDGPETVIAAQLRSNLD